MSDQVSVIIPVYNAKKYLDECVSSVLEQDYPFIEIILVDDGSSDGSGELCDSLEGDYIRVMHQKNSGPAAARNAGLLAAGGSFVMFLDADDMLDGPGVVSAIYTEAKNSGADIVQGAYRRQLGAGISGVNLHGLSGLDRESESFRFLGFYKNGHLAYDWGKLYRRDFLIKNGLLIEDYGYAEDKAHNFRCYALGAVYAFSDVPVCRYRDNPDSASNAYIDGLIPAWTSVAGDFLKWCEKKGIGERYFDLAAYHIAFGAFYLAKKECQAKGKPGHTAKALREYISYDISAECLARLAKGRYMEGIDSFLWRVFMRGSAWMLTHRMTGLYALGAHILTGIRLDALVMGKRFDRQ